MRLQCRVHTQKSQKLKRASQEKVVILCSFRTLQLSIMWILDLSLTGPIGTGYAGPVSD